MTDPRPVTSPDLRLPVLLHNISPVPAHNHGECGSDHGSAAILAALRGDGLTLSPTGPISVMVDPLIADDERLEAEIARLREAIQTVLDDAESQHPGGWGPDVTMVAVLREALATPEDGGLRPTQRHGWHGDGEFDVHYDQWCPRCTTQRDRLRPETGMDVIYAEVPEEPTE